MYKNKAPTFVPLALAGGQGKSTIALMLARLIARCGVSVLLVDADPQASLTAFLGITPDLDKPTLLDVLTNSEKKIPLYSAIIPVPENENIYLIPATDQLESANHYLAASGISLNVLRNKLYQEEIQIDENEKVANNFGIIIVDPPPERSHLALTSLGSGDAWVIPSEANVKGVQSLLRTMELINSYATILNKSKKLGVIPFRAKWVGYHPTRTTKQSIETMTDLVGKELMLPHLLESDIYKRAINEQMLPRDLGKPEIEAPILAILKRLQPFFSDEIQSLISEEIKTYNLKEVAE